MAASDLEQLLLEYVNDARLNPTGDAARYISSYSPLTSPDTQIQNALSYFGVSGSALQSAYQALTPVQPVAWNDALANATRAHDQAMISSQTQTHQAPGEAELGVRDTQAGYTGWSALGENVYAYATSPLMAQAGFMVDWGNGPDGMQNPAGHRENIMNGAYKEVGVGIVAETTTANPVGPEVITEDFGVRQSSGNFVLGVAYTDNDGNDFYSLGEGRGDLQVSAAGGSTTSAATGGYQLATSTAAQTISLSGGGLSGGVTVAIGAGTSNIKLDVVNGTELKMSGSGTVSGPVSTVEATFAGGETIAVTGSSQHHVIGNVGNDALTAGSGGDYLLGGAGADTLQGGGGNDHLYGQSSTGGTDGADRLSGGDGSDYLQGNAGADTLDGGNGSDRIFGGADGDLITGGAGNDSVNGNLGNDTISGGNDNDYLRGGQGDDSITGDTGNDTLSGDVGNDTVSGGAGIDVLTGGSGADTFRFAAHDAAFTMSSASLASDTITDFEHGSDHIGLGFAVAGVLTGAAQATAGAAESYAQTLLAGHTGDVVALGVGGDTFLFYGSGGSTTIDSAIKLAGLSASAIGTGDFI